MSGVRVPLRPLPPLACSVDPGRRAGVQMFQRLGGHSEMARHRPTMALAALVAAAAASGSPAGLGAQVQRTIQRQQDTPGMMIPAFRSPAGDKKLGVQAADAVRSRLMQDIAYKTLWQIPKQDIVAT